MTTKSMTGFGRSAGTLPDGTEASVVVRGVNHRFLDVSLKMRDEWASLEPAVRRLVADTVKRGHVDVLVRTSRAAGRAASFDEEAAARYAGLWKLAAERSGLPADLSARDLLSLPGVVRSEEGAEGGDDPSREALLALVRAALDEFDATRRREGAALQAAVGTVLGRLEQGIARLDAERASSTGIPSTSFLTFSRRRWRSWPTGRT